MDLLQDIHVHLSEYHATIFMMFRYLWTNFPFTFKLLQGGINKLKQILEGEDVQFTALEFMELYTWVHMPAQFASIGVHGMAQSSKFSHKQAAMAQYFGSRIQPQCFSCTYNSDSCAGFVTTCAPKSLQTIIQRSCMASTRSLSVYISWKRSAYFLYILL